MSIPNTFLLTAPHDVDDAFGRAMSSHDMIQGLQAINPAIWADETYTPGVWWPGKDRGITCLWMGPRGCGNCKKLTAFVPGAIPEHTQLGPTGQIIALGWRHLFEKLIRLRAVSRRALENRFRVTLDVVEKDSGGYCPRCRKMGKKEASTGADNLCNFHHELRRKVLAEQARQRDLRYLERKAGLCPRSLSSLPSSRKASPMAPSSASKH